MPEYPAPRDMPAPTVDTVLMGYRLRSDQGSAGLCGVYLVEHDHKRILFDCGHAGRRQALHRALAYRGMHARDIDTLVLSHAHWDHIQNADLFQHADVLMHPEELSHLRTPPIDDPATPPWSAAVLQNLTVRPVMDGYTITSCVSVVGLPGHTVGSIGLRVDTAGGTALLSGDAVSSANALRAGRCTVVTAGEELAARTMEHARSAAALVYPGHDRPFTVVDGRPDRYLALRCDMVSTPPDPLTAEPS